MTGRATLLVRAAGALGLAVFGVLGAAGQDKVAPKPAPPRPVAPPVKAAPLVKVAPRLAAPNVEEAWAQQFEQQYGPQFRQLFKSELHFMRLVCQPTRAQYEAVAADGEPALKAATQKFAVVMRGGLPNDSSDPRAVIAAVVAKSVRNALTAEQAAKYQAEVDQRAAARKRAARLTLVAAIDKTLALTPDQRGRVERILEENWNESWNQTQALIYSARYLPQLPDAKIVPLLTDAQKDVWRRVPKGNVRFGFDMSFLQGVVVEDEVWDEVPAGEKKERK